MKQKEFSHCRLCAQPLVPFLPKVVDPQSREVFRIDRCSSCALGHTLPQPEDLGAYYGERYYGNRHGLTQKLYLRRRTGLVKTMNGTGKRLLDVGCGDGGFLLAMQADGFEVTGTELNVERVRQKGLSVFETIDETQARGTFDNVTFWHTLEHFKDPLAALKDARKRIASDGMLFVAVPDAGGAQARVFAEQWLHLDVPRHLFHFTREALELALQTSGFRAVEFWHQELEIDWFGMIQSALNRALPTPNALFNMVLGQPTTASLTEKAISLALAPTLAMAALPLVPLAGALKTGATLVVAARPA